MIKNQVEVKVPNDTDMALEPATTIAKLTQIKNAVAIMLVVAGYGISPVLDGAIDQFVQAGVTLAFMVWALYSTWKQGKDTRESVYAPQTVADIVDSMPPVPKVTEGDPEHADVPADDPLHMRT